MISARLARLLLIAVVSLSAVAAGRAETTEQAFLAELNKGMQGDTLATGTVTWTLEQTAKPKRKPELAVRAEIAIPDRNLKLTWRMQRNADKAVFATHVIAVTVRSLDGAHGAMRDVFGMLLRPAQDGNGTALFATHEKSGDGMFRSYLAPNDFAANQNDRLLKARPWFELRFTYTDGKQVILAFDKGASGERAFAAAFQAWGSEPRIAASEDVEELPGPAIMFFLARGAPNACGPGCSEWIAAEGYFDQSAPDRFRAFRRSLGPGERPIFFNSKGGNAGSAGAVAALLRKYRMRAGVGQTIPDSCPAGMENERCRSLVQPAQVTEARLKPNAICASACVEAFLGASRREVAPGARLGIHRARVEAGTGTAAAMLDRYYRAVKQRMLQFGVEPALADLAATVPPESIRFLTDAEMKRFGVVPASSFETRWTLFDDMRKPAFVLKAITEAKASASKDYRTGVVRLSCADNGGIVFAYRRELNAEDPDDDAALSVKLGESRVTLEPKISAGAGLSQREGVVPAELFRNAASQMIVITETLGANERSVKLSTAGLPDAFAALETQCAPQKSADAGRLAP